MDYDEEMKKHFAALSVPTLPADSLVLRDMLPAARQYLEKHGCVIVEENEGVKIIYPVGTTRTEILPRTMCERYRVMLPDGTELQEAHSRLMNGDNGLWVPQEAFHEPTKSTAS